MEEVKIQGGKVLDACNEVQIQVGVLVIILILTICGKQAQKLVQVDALDLSL